jgi:hypothetical protein
MRFKKGEGNAHFVLYAVHLLVKDEDALKVISNVD